MVLRTKLIFILTCENSRIFAFRFNPIAPFVNTICPIHFPGQIPLILPFSRRVRDLSFQRRLIVFDLTIERSYLKGVTAPTLLLSTYTPSFFTCAKFYVRYGYRKKHARRKLNPPSYVKNKTCVSIVSRNESLVIFKKKKIQNIWLNWRKCNSIFLL